MSTRARDPRLTCLSACLWFTDYFCHRQGGDLFHHLRRCRHQGKTAAGLFLGLERARFYSAEMVSAIAHLHSLNIAYRDMKPSNVMSDMVGHVRLVDFGLCKQQVGTAVSAKLHQE